MSYIRGLLGVHPDSKKFRLPERQPLLGAKPFEDLPENFDARTNWDKCPTIGEIRDQGSCGSCWVRRSDDECHRTHFISLVIKKDD